MLHARYEAIPPQPTPKLNKTDSSTRPRAIVLIPQDPASQPSPLPASPGSMNPSDPLAGLGQMNVPNMCLCPVASSTSAPGSAASWMGHGSGAAPYVPVCPLHKPQWLSNYQVMML